MLVAEIKRKEFRLLDVADSLSKVRVITGD